MKLQSNYAMLWYYDECYDVFSRSNSRDVIVKLHQVENDFTYEKTFKRLKKTCCGDNLFNGEKKIF